MINNIMIFRTDRIGDLLISCPAIITIKNYIKDSNITLITSKKNYEYARSLNLFDKVYKFPDKNLPCLIMYHEGEMQHQTVGLSSFGGIRMTPDHLEWRLSQFNVLETEFTILNNPMTMKGSPTLKTASKRPGRSRSASSKLCA